MKNIFTGLLFLSPFFISFSLQAQVAPPITWQKCLGGSSGETSEAIQQTIDGGFIVAGYSFSPDGDIAGNHGASDYWIVKLDTAGNIQWQKCYGGSANDVAWAIQQTADGGFITAGYSRSHDGDIPINHGLTDYCIMKLDASGNLIWQKSLGGSDDDWAYAVQQSLDGGFIVAGLSKSNDGDVSGNHGDWDYWIVKLDANGNLVWQKPLGGSDEDECYALALTSDDGIVVAGGADSDDGDVSTNHGSGDDWIVKLDANGNILWQKSFGGSGDDYAYAIQQTTDNGLIIAGSSTSSDGDIAENKGHTDYSIMKLDADGSLLWEKTYGGSGYEAANSIQQTSDGGFIVAGDSYSSDLDVSGNHGGTDCWILKLDSEGNLQWQKSLGGSQLDQANAIMQSADGSFVIAGLTFSNDGDVSGNHTNDLGNTEDYWIVKLSSNAQSGIESIPRNSISIFPNPVHDILTVDFPATDLNVSISVFDVQGRRVNLPITITNTQSQLNASALPSGFYTLQITDTNTGMRELQKFVKQD